jgi:hypothetical protein
MNGTTATETYQPLTEQVTDWRSDVTVDFEHRQVKNIVLSGGVSRNGHRYTEEALRDAVTRIRGDIDVLDTEAGRTFLALMEGRSPAVGMSHVVLAQRGSNPQIVERIHDVVSVDAVVFPATTNGFHESDQTALPGSWEALIEQIDAQLPAAVTMIAGHEHSSSRRLAVLDGIVLVEVRQPEETATRRYEFGWQTEQDRVQLSFRNELAATETIAERCHAATLRLQEQSRHTITALQRVLAEVAAERDQLRSHQEKHALDVLMESAGLPAFAVTDAFREQLRSLPDGEPRRRCIAERADFIRRYQPRPISSTPRSAPNIAADTAFVRAIRGQRTRAID